MFTSSDASLLIVKLTVPPLRPGHVSRPRLVERINQLSDRKLILISAPAGYGKTSLLSEWSQQSEWPVGWLSLDRDDDDVHRFLTYLVAAWETIHPDIHETPLGLLAGSLMPSVDKILSSLLNEATARSSHFVLVIDDFHAIQDQAVHEALTFILDHLPPQMHLALAARSDPPLPLARLRSRGELTELRASDLRFTTGEAAEFITGIKGNDELAGNIDGLVARTEGWVTGLRLATLSPQTYGEVANQTKEISGDDRYIADFLVGEVLSQHSESHRAFLAQTSIVDRLCAPLCDAITGRSDGQKTLEDLEQANLFLIPLDNHRRWYRYHQLFAEFLRSYLSKALGNEAAIFHRRASRWYAANGFPDEAFRHAVAGEDFEYAADIVDINFTLKLAYGQLRILSDWLQSLPAEILISRPQLGVYRSMLLLLGGQPGACIKCLEEIERQIGLGHQEPTEESRTQLARISATRSIIACFQNDLESAINSADQAFQDLPADDVFFRFGVNIALGDTYRRGSQWASAVEPYTEALKIARKAPVPFIAIHPLSALSDLYMMRGQLRRASEFREEALSLVADQVNRAGIAVPLVGWAYIRMGELLYEWNNLASALDHLLRGTELAELGGDTRALVFGYLGIGRIKLAQGDATGTIEQLQRAKPLVEGAEMPDWTNLFSELQVQFWLAQGNIRAATAWVEETRFSVDDESSYQYEIGRLAMARVLVAQGEQDADAAALDRANVLLSRLLKSAEAAGRMGVVVEVLALQALVHRAQGDITQAMVALDKALRLAEPEGYLRRFADMGTSMAALLQLLRSRGIHLHYVNALLNAFGPDLPELATAAIPLIEPLSDRELEVLRLVAAGLSNRKVADELIIAIGTVKRHVATIYQKLGVNSRTQAVARARELNVLH